MHEARLHEVRPTEALLVLQKASEAEWGRTAPNPPVAAALFDQAGKLLLVRAHCGAGLPHAEALLLTEASAQGLLSRAHSLWVSLEPCHHHGRTPPCSQAILNSPLRQIVYAFRDPHLKASGGGLALAQAGCQVDCLEDLLPAEMLAGVWRPQAGFFKVVREGLPWVTVKTAHRSGHAGAASMIPPTGQKTFTSTASLLLAHTLRKRADAILTGSGTWLADRPEFTVRHLPDHPGKIRRLGILDRRARIPESQLVQARSRGLLPERIGSESLEALLRRWALEGALEVLVEAGPTLSEEILRTGLWDEHVIITSRSDAPESEDTVEVRQQRNGSSCSPA